MVNFTTSVYVNLSKYVPHHKEAEIINSIAIHFQFEKSLSIYYVPGTVLGFSDTTGKNGLLQFSTETPLILELWTMDG